MRVILSGGGTGGHIYPAVSIAKEIKKQHKNAEILFIGTERGLRAALFKEGFKLIKIKVRGFRRKLSFENITAVAESFIGLFRYQDYKGFQAGYSNWYGRICVQLVSACCFTYEYTDPYT